MKRETSSAYARRTVNRHATGAKEAGHVLKYLANDCCKAAHAIDAIFQYCLAKAIISISQIRPTGQSAPNA